MNEHMHGMTGAWALNALDGEEREQMLRYLEEDPEAAAEALSFEETAGELAGKHRLRLGEADGPQPQRDGEGGQDECAVLHGKPPKGEVMGDEGGVMRSALADG